MRRFWSLLNAELRMTVRNRQRIVVGFATPILLMLVIGWAFGGGQPLALPIGVVDHDGSELSRTLTRELRAHASSGVRVSTGSEAAELDRLRTGERRLVIVIPAGFEATAVGFQTSLVVYDDPSDPQNAQLALTVMHSALAEMRARTEGEPTLGVERRSIAGGRRFTYLDFLAPGLLGMGAMNIALMGSTASIITYRERGILRRIRVTPLPLWAFVAGSSVVSLMMAAVQVFILLGVAIVVFGVQVAGSWAALVLIVVIGNAAFVNLGVIIASIANTFQSGQVIAVAAVLPMIFLSGTFFQVEAMPAFLQPLVQVLPLTHLISALRAVALRGATLGSVAPQLAILVGTGIVLFAAAIRMFRWE